MGYSFAYRSVITVLDLTLATWIRPAPGDFHTAVEGGRLHGRFRTCIGCE